MQWGHHLSKDGRVQAVTNSDGEMRAHYRYGVYGETERVGGGTTNRFGYHGHVWDPITGLYQMRARYYAPKLGRFMARDPIGVLGGRNLYAFAMNRPNDLSDRFGLSPNVNPYTSGDMCSAYPCGEAETEFGHNPYLQEVFEETLSGVSSGMVTSLWPGGAVAEGITGVDTVEFLSGEEIYHGASYYLAKGVTEVVVGSVEMVGGGSMFASGATLTVVSGGTAAPASVPMAAGGAAVAVQGYTTAGGGLSNVGQGIDLVFNKGDSAGGQSAASKRQRDPGLSRRQ